MEKIRVGLIGTGFIAEGLYELLKENDTLALTCIRTRRDITRIPFGKEILKTNIDKIFLNNCDLAIECSGDAVYATPIVRRCLEKNKIVITMDAELQITSGTYLKKIGGDLFTEAEGDQPGCLAALKNEAIAMGFLPLVYGNIKGFLDYNPTKENMLFWSKKSGISLEQVTSFTDGTKISIEQVLVCNGLNADIAKSGMIGFTVESNHFKEGALSLAKYADENDIILSDFLLSSKNAIFNSGVFLVCKHKKSQEKFLKYYKLGEGPYYIIEKPYHLCHMEILKTIYNTLNGKKPLLTNDLHPRYSVLAIAKRNIKKGEYIKRAIGSFEFRGIPTLISNNPNHIPIGLISDAILKKDILEGAFLTYDDVIIKESEAYRAWKEIVKI